MARFSFDGVEACAGGLEAIGRPQIRRIGEVGADAAIDRMKNRINDLHYGYGDMYRSVDRGEYKETIGGGSQVVYPQGDDRKGERNATKAFVINYGRGGARKTPHMRDHFISDDSAAEEIVQGAMEREYDRIMAEQAR